MNDSGDGAVSRAIAHDSETVYRKTAAPAMPDAIAPPAHLVQFYDDDETLAMTIARFVADGLSAGDVVTTIATDDHTRAFDRRLRVDGVDVDAARASGRLLSLDAHQTLASFMRDGEPD